MDAETILTRERLKAFVVELHALCDEHGLHVRNDMILSDSKPNPEDIHLYSDVDGHHAISRDPSFNFYGRLATLSPAELESLVSEIRLRDRKGFFVRQERGL